MRRPGNRGAMTQEEERELRAQLARAATGASRPRAAIEALQVSPGSDLLQVQRLKEAQTAPQGPDYVRRGSAHAGYYCLVRTRTSGQSAFSILSAYYLEQTVDVG